MKIIRPMDLMADGAVESNAPGDGFTLWQPLGRDNTFLNGFTTMSLGQDLAYIKDPDGPKIKVFDLDSSEFLSEISGFAPVIDSISVSPDNSFLAYIEIDSTSPFYYNIKVIDLSTGQQVYSDSTLGAFSDPVWDIGSGFLAYLETIVSPNVARVNVVSPSSWSAPSQTANLLLESTLPQVDSYQIGGLSIDSSGNSFFAARTFNNAGQRSSFIVKCSSLGSTLARSSISSALFLDGVFLNIPRGEVIVHGSSPHSVFLSSDLSSVSTPAILSGYNIKRASISRDGSEIVVQSTSVQPYIRRINATDYSAGAAFPVSENFNDAEYSDSYIVFLRPDGSYEIVDLATNGLLEQTNPTVTAGDIYTYGDRNYEALEDNNDRPDLGAQLEVPTWLNLGAINPLRMFDGKLDSRTTAPSPLTITVTPGMITNGLALFNVSAASVQVVMDDPTDGVVYDSGEIQMLDNSAVNNWWDFFFAPYLEKADLALIDLPPYPDATLTITLSSDGGDVALGELVLGRVQNIGEAQYGTSVGIIDSSTKERDVFGNFEIIERKFSKRAEFDVSVPTSSASGMQRILAQYRATPVVWVGNMGLEATIVYGFYRDFQINFSHYSLSDATITVEGL